MPVVKLSYDFDEATQDFFWERVVVSGPIHPTLGKCWTWLGAKIGDGYGLTLLPGGKYGRAHRFAYTFLVRRVGEDEVIDHLCRNKSCVNPAHLEPVSNRVNILRGESPSATQARRTHCVRGHPLSGVNLVVYYGSVRQCLVCKKLRNDARGLNRRKRTCTKCGSLKEGGVRGVRLCNTCREES